MSVKPNAYWNDRIKKATARVVHFTIRCQTEPDKLLLKDLINCRDNAQKRLDDLLNRFNQGE